MTAEPMPPEPRISFGIIVLNGEPFTRYCLRALYPHAHEILVVEGACGDAAATATADGHSTDGTVEAIRRFQREEDPEGKVQLIQREGFWPEKDEQSQAYADRATGDWLWQVDVDEFYLDSSLRRMRERLGSEPEISGASFQQVTFWGDLDYACDGFYLRRGANVCPRLFRWGPGYHYVTHRPATVADAKGRNLESLHWLDGKELARDGVFFHHYSLLFPKQVEQKCAYYGKAEQFARPHAEAWARECFDRLERPYRVHNVYDHPSWLEAFTGEHPAAAHAMMADIRAGLHDVALRPCDDVAKLLGSRRYRIGRAVLKAIQPIDALAWRIVQKLRALGATVPRSWRSYRVGGPT